MKYFLLLNVLIAFTTDIFSQQVAVQLSKMNILYEIVPNPIKVVVENYPCNKVIVGSKYGKINKVNDDQNDGQYYYKTSQCDRHTDSIFIGILEKGSIKWVDTLNYRIISVLDAVEPNFQNRFNNSCIKKEYLLKIIKYAEDSIPGLEKRDYNELYLSAPLINFDINLSFKIVRYCVDLYRNDSIVYSEECVSDEFFSRDLINQLKLSKSGDELLFYNITVKYLDCEKVVSDYKLKIK